MSRSPPTLTKQSPPFASQEYSEKGEDFMRTYWWTRITCALVLVGAMGLSAPSWVAADVNPGDTVTKDNMAEAADLLIPGIQWFVENGMPIQVGEYKKVNLPKLYAEATEKYSGQVQLSADGREMFNYVAGVPFPNIDPNDPMAGSKIMWNQEQKPAYVDNVGTEWIVELVNARGEMERMYGSQFWRRMMWTGRLYTDP